MSDYSEWLETGAGTDAAPFGEEEDLLSYRAARNERDAVLCLVDCNPSMFIVPSPSPSLAAHRGGGGVSAPTSTTTIVKQEGQSSSSSMGDHVAGAAAFRHVGGAQQQQQQQQGQSHPPPAAKSEAVAKTPFQLCMRAILDLYKEKIITSERDVLALALYNTAEPYNKLSVEGFYVIHPFDTLGVESIQEVERLEAAGAPGSAAYKEFAAKVGHRRSELPSALPDALWAAQHMFQQLRSDAIQYRRIFIFTNEDNPTRGDELSRRRCGDRARDLYDAGVELLVSGMDCSSGTAATASSARGEAHHPSSTSREATGGASIFASATTPFGAPPLPSGGREAEDEGRLPGLRRFEPAHFWEPLVLQGARGSLQRSDSVARESGHTFGSVVDVDDADVRSAASAFGAVWVCSGADSMLELQQAVRQKVHAQRPILSCRLVLGVGAPGQALPAMSVSVYTPVLRAKPPAAEWLERATNAVVKRRNRLVVRPPPAPSTNEESDGEDADEEETKKEVRTVAPEDVQYSITVGGHAVHFTAAERAKLVEVAAAGIGVGLTVICFKSVAAIAPVPYALSRSSFVHANLRTGGTHALRLFVQLVRSLHRKGRVAIAQFRLRATSAPRLVALLPSLEAAGAPAGSLPAEGLGFYLYPLPYGDDLRPDPDLATATLAVRQNPPKATEPPTEAQVGLARELAEKLTVGYSITAVPNPSLQLHYRTLEDLAVRQLPAGGAEVKDEGGAPGRPAFVDYTLPDAQGMALFRDLMHQFNTLVLSGEYSADALCPGAGDGGAAAAAGGAGSRKRVKKEEEGGDAGAGEGGAVTAEEAARRVCNRVAQAEENGTLQDMTVVELKEYLRAVKAPGGGAKRKAELIEAVVAALKKEQKKKSIKKE